MLQSWGHKELDITEQLNSAEESSKGNLYCFQLYGLKKLIAIYNVLLLVYIMF